MHWAIWQQIKSPPKGFEDVVRTHFKQRQKHVSFRPHKLVYQAYPAYSRLALPAAMLCRMSDFSVKEALLKLQHKNCRPVCVLSEAQLVRRRSRQRHARIVLCAGA